MKMRYRAIICRLFTRFGAESAGQAIVEFALVVPLFLLLAVGLVEFGQAWTTYQTVANAAREGARVAILADPAITQDSVRSSIRKALQMAALDPARATITLTGVGGSTGTLTEVQLKYPLDLTILGRLSGGKSGGKLNLSTTVVMRHE